VATRLYLQASGAAAVTAPALPSGWTAGTTAAIQRKTTTGKTNTALSDFLVAETTASVTNIPIGIFISNPLVGASISGTFSAVIRGFQSVTTSDDSLQVGLYLIAGDGSSVLSTLYAGHTTGLGTTSGALGEEFANTAATRRIPSGTAITTQTAVTGNRLMVIVGYRAHNTTANSRSATLRFGDPTAPADFALTAGLTTDLVPWVELSATLTFSDPLIQTITDPLGITDSSQGTTRSITITDQVTIQDDRTAALGGTPFTRSQTDNLGLTDAPQVKTWQATVNEVVFLTDSLTVVESTGGTLTRTITDPLDIDDTPAVELRTFNVTLTEDLGITDTRTQAATFTRGQTDDLGLSDPITAQVDKTITDALGITDDRTVDFIPGVLSRSVTDDLGVTDTAAQASVFDRTITDPLGLSDPISVQLDKALSDPVGVTDTQTVASTFNRTVSDDLGVTDSTSSGLVTSRSITDDLGVTDSPLVIEQTKGATVTDPLGITDAPLVVASVFSRTIDDALGLTDPLTQAGSFTRTIDDALGLTDEPIPVATFVRAVTEALGITDTATPELTKSRSVTDDLGITDTVTPTLTAMTFGTALEVFRQVRTATEVARLVPTMTEVTRG